MSLVSRKKNESFVVPHRSYMLEDETE